MSDSQSDRAASRAQGLLDYYLGLDPTYQWTLPELQRAAGAFHESGTGQMPFQPGQVLPALGSQDLQNLGLFNYMSPEKGTSVMDYIAQQGMTPAQYQQQVGSLPFDINADNTWTFNPDAQKVNFDYAEDPGWFKIAPLIMAGIATGGFGLGAGLGAGVATPAGEFGWLGDAAAGGATSAGSSAPSWTQMLQGDEAFTNFGVDPGSFSVPGASPPGLPDPYSAAEIPEVYETPPDVGGPPSTWKSVPPMPPPHIPGQGGTPPPTGEGTGDGGFSLPGMQDVWNWFTNAFPSLLQTGLGYWSAQQSADRADDVYDEVIERADQDRADRLPFLNTAQGWTLNPSTYWEGPLGQEIARQTSRQISGLRQENLYDNPTGQSLLMQSMVPSYFNAVTQMANQGLRNSAPLGEIGAIGMQSANAAGRPGAVIGAGVADLLGGRTGDIESLEAILRRYGYEPRLP